MTLDTQITRELDRRASVYRTYKELDMDARGLTKNIVWNCEWIQRVCGNEGYETKPYIEYFGNKISGAQDE